MAATTFTHISKTFAEGDLQQTRAAAYEFALELARQGHAVRVEWSYCDAHIAYTTPADDRYGHALCPTCGSWIASDGSYPCQTCTGARS